MLLERPSPLLLLRRQGNPVESHVPLSHSVRWRINDSPSSAAGEAPGREGAGDAFGLVTD
jgi:hypothetical protein